MVISIDIPVVQMGTVVKTGMCCGFEDPSYRIQWLWNCPLLSEYNDYTLFTLR